MKKCPFCGADIEDSARFCLYCMQSLTEKKQLLPHQKKKPQWFMIIVAIVVPIIIFSAVWLSIHIALKNGMPSDTLSVTESAHTPATAVTENYIEATCTQTGSYDEVIYCSECHEEISRTQKMVDKKPHDYNQKITTTEYLKTETTCTDSAVYYYSCVCGVKGTITFTDGEANGHGYSSTWEKNATHHWHKATCEHITEISGKDEHNYGTDNICDTCGYERTVNVSSVTLNFSSLTLTEDDEKSLTATITPNNSTNQNVEWTTSNASVVTVDANGKITAVGVGTAVITATTADGNKTAQCTVVVSAKVCPHTTLRTERENEVDSTCKKAGTYDEVVYCTTCGDELSRSEKTIPASGHTFDEWTVVQAPTCTVKGIKLRVCFCSEKETEVIPAVGHSYGAWIVDKPATCTGTGTKHRVCSVCNESESGTIPLNTSAHNYASVWTSDDTHHWHKCLNSGCTSTSDKTSHTFGEWIVDSVANCAKTGTRHHVCTICQKSVSETYSNPSTHSYDTAWTADDTHHWHKCLNSGCTAVSEKTAHNITNGFCRDCGVKNVNTETYTRDGNYIYFGEYPQTLKADNVTITANMDDRGYYVGSDGCYYAKVQANPRYTTYKFQSGKTIVRYQYYYFKVEPLRWRILSEDGDTALIFCDSIIANKAYSENYTSTYGNSAIRAWLNDQFYNVAFSCFQKELIDTVLMENSLGDDTEDKVFLLRQNDVINPNYGFDPNNTVSDDARRIIVNDYARATGTDMSNGFGVWLLGEAEFGSYAGSMNVLLVGDDGRADYCSTITGDCWGVVPTLQIQLSGNESYVDTTGLMYKINNDGSTCTVTGIGSCTENRIIIPEKINGMKVTAIGDAAFWGGTFTNITIHDSVTSIGNNAFGNCRFLTDITFPDSITRIGERAFEYCTALTSVTFGENSRLTSIEDYAFSNCKALVSIMIPRNVTSIGGGAFASCRIRRVYITDLSAWCKISFRDANSSPFFSNWDAEFYLNGQLVTELVIPTDVTCISSYAFKSCYSIESVIITDNVTSIGDRTFFNCFHLESVTIPVSVTSIGNKAFAQCSHLSTINYCGTEEQWQTIAKDIDWNPQNVIFNYKGQ